MSLTDQDLKQLEQLYFDGKFPELESVGVKLTTQYPHLGMAWSILAAALTAQGKPALEAHARSAELLPQDPQAQLQYADALLAAGQFDDAVATYNRAIALQPDWAVAYNNLGNAFNASGQVGSARHSYEQALQWDPRFALAHYNLALLNRDDQRWDEVEPALRLALEADPSLAPGWVELASVIKDQGKLADAEAALVKAIELSPQLLQARLNLATILLLRSNANSAMQTLLDCLSLHPTSAQTHLQLGMTLYGLGRAHEARASVEHALTLQDDLIDGYRLLSDIACEQGDMKDAIAMLEKVFKLDSSNIPARSTFLFYRSQLDDVPPEALFAEHAAFGALLREKYASDQLGPRLNRQANHRLRVGFLSGDFSNHIVGRSLLPVLKHLSGMDDVELVAYYNNNDEDDWTFDLKNQFASWNAVVGMAPHALARRIYTDKIDILIDLSGHTPLNCLPVFALRPAPLQVSWLGYTWTTGLREIDYYLADQCWLQPGNFDHLFTEKLAYLSAFLPFEFYGKSPPVNGLPSQEGAPFTFASFNHVRKLSAEVLRTWAQILSATANSRLLIGGVDDLQHRDKIAATFAAVGISPERLVFFPRYLAFDYLQLHHMVDLCLDAFPYPSATTIQHALWMGVPTITSAGRTPVSRAGASVIQHLELPQFIAHNLDDYVGKAINAAQQPQLLAALRQELRQKLTQSAQGRSSAIARSLHSALRTMWKRYLQNEAATSFVAYHSIPTVR